MSNTDEREALMGVILGIITLGLIPISYLLYGFVLKTMWAWFLVPLGLPSIGLGTAIGIRIMYTLIEYNTHSPEEEDTVKKFIIALATMVFKPLICLGLGYLAHTFLFGF